MVDCQGVIGNAQHIGNAAVRVVSLFRGQHTFAGMQLPGDPQGLEVGVVHAEHVVPGFDGGLGLLQLLVEHLGLKLIEGDLLVVGWGSTLGAIEEAVDIARSQGKKVSSTHLRFLSPLEPGLKKIFSGFRKVMTIEINYSDDPDTPMITEENRRYSQLATMLRAHTLMDIDCWSKVPGHPLQPGMIRKVIDSRLAEIKGA